MSGEPMKKRIPLTIVVSVLAGSLLLFGAGCGKKTVIPPDSTTTTSGPGMSGGTSIPYPTNTSGSGSGYTEENLPKEDSLDNPGTGVVMAGDPTGTPT